MNLTTAKAYADKIAAWLQPHCLRLEIVGSIRRHRPECADVDIVCIPKVTATTDLLGAPLCRVNHVLGFLQRYESDNAGRARFISGGEKEGKQIIFQLPKCQLDLWFAEEKNIGTRMVCRTGSKEHNILIAQRALDLGGNWNPYEGVTLGGRLMPAETEQQVYEALNLPFIEPRDREGEFVAALIRAHSRNSRQVP